jgi:hypothetical protein
MTTAAKRRHLKRGVAPDRALRAPQVNARALACQWRGRLEVR